MARHWCFTLNNYTEEQYDEILGLDTEYLVVGREVGESGTPHLQGYLTLRKKGRVLKLLKKSKPHWEVMRGTPRQASDYCKKDNVYFERGDLPCANEIERWDRARTAASEGRMDDIPSDIYVRHYSSLYRIYQDSMPDPGSRNELRNYWIYGATGCGKSSGVREFFGDENIYPKPLNKWWDGYKNQRVVLIEEVSPRDKEWLGEKLKVWADHYPFIGEVKGRSVLIRPPIVVVTSNYSLSECFPEPQVQEPLVRRFKVLHMISYNNLTGLFDYGAVRLKN